MQRSHAADRLVDEAARELAAISGKIGTALAQLDAKPLRYMAASPPS